MERNEIISKVKDWKSTLLPPIKDRGPWGDSSWRGNCSGYLIAWLIYMYNVRKLAEPFAGSGTGYDVALDMGIKYAGSDLNPNPVRKGIEICDLLKDPVPEKMLDADMFFMHPPYSELIHIPYAGSMYEDKDGSLSGSDLGQMPWDKFMRCWNEIVAKIYCSMEPGSKMALLMGDIRRQGNLYSMLTDTMRPGKLVQICIREQCNTSSFGKKYSNQNFISISHEWIVILEKLRSYMISYSQQIRRQLDIRDSKTATWRDVIRTVIAESGGSASLQEIYDAVMTHEKAKNNTHPKEKVRQTLYNNTCFIQNGQRWSFKAA